MYSANLHWCNFSEADLRGTNLNHMNATDAFFCGAYLNGFEHAILIKTDFKDARFPLNIIWSYRNMDWEMSAKELLARYNAGERDFRGVKLIETRGSINLQGRNLQEINLRGAYLEKVDLSGADLSGADLFGASLANACLKKAIVRDANLYSANLHWCNLSEADLRGTRLNHMNASNACFCGANLVGGFEYAILIQTNFQDAAIFPNVIYSYGNYIEETTMPDGTIIKGPFFGDW